MANQTDIDSDNDSDCSNCGYYTEENEVINDDEIVADISHVARLDKNTNLHFAAARGLLLSIPVNLETPDQKIDDENYMGWTPLMMAVRNGHVEVTKLLLEKGADVTKKNKFGVNIFTMSIATGNLDLMKIILQHMLKGGISRNRIQEHLSPISLTILFKRTILIDWLIDQGFDINGITSKTGLTPLMFAAALSLDDTVCNLESKNADKTLKNYMNFTYKDIALWRCKGLNHVMDNFSTIEPKAQNRFIKRGRCSTELRSSSPKIKTNRFISPNINYKVPNNTPNSTCKPTVDQKTLQNTKPKISIKLSAPAETSSGMDNTLKDHDENGLTWQQKISNCRPQSQIRTRFGDENLPMFCSPGVNMHYPMYLPVMNSPFCVQNVPSPLTPFMVPSPYENFIKSVSDLPQNSPMGFLPSPYNVYQGPGSAPQVFFAPQIPITELHNYQQSCNNSLANQALYHYYSPSKNT